MRSWLPLREKGLSGTRHERWPLAAWAWVLGGLLLGGLCFAKAASQAWSTEGRTTQRSQSVARPVSATDVVVGGKVYHTKAIADIKEGDRVLAEDPETGTRTLKKVLKISRTIADELCIVRTRSADGQAQEIKATGDHRFWVTGKGWVPATELCEGQEVRQPDGRLGRVLGTRSEERPEGVTVCNFVVEGYHTYFVMAPGAEGPVLVHNGGPCLNFGALPRSGTIDPRKVRFSQDNIRRTFSDGRLVSDLAAELKLHPETAGQIPAIRIVEREGSIYKGQIYTLDNRRLKAFQDAGVEIRYIKLDKIPKRQLRKFTTTNDGIDIIVRGEK